VQVCHSGLSAVNADGCDVNGAFQEQEGTVVQSQANLHPKQSADGLVRLGVDAIF